jgi:hypothetical protein
LDSILDGFNTGFITGSNTGFPIRFNIGSNIGSSTGDWVGCLNGLAWLGWLGIGFVDIWGHGQEFIKSSILGSVLSTSGAMARNSSNRASWDRFCRHLEPWLGSHQIEHPGIGSVDIWGHGQEVIKSTILGSVLSTSGAIHGQEIIKSSILGSVPSTSGAMARKSSNRASWDRFRPHLEPWPGNH